VLELDTVVLAVTMGAPRYNRKPVLTVFDERGRLRAFAKYGADATTDRYVQTEAEWLGRIARKERPGFIAPGVRWAGSWRGHELVVADPVHPYRRPTRRDILEPPSGLVESIAALGAVQTMPVGRTDVIRHASSCTDPAIQDAADHMVDRWGQVEVRTGAWHGDLSPWNLSTRSNRPTIVWDWEAAEDGRPVGADHLHSSVMVRTHLRSWSAADAVAALESAVLRRHQPSERSCEAARDLYLLDVARRDRDIIDSGVDADLLPGIGAAALDRLSHD
jgi:hypothetical protein